MLSIALIRRDGQTGHGQTGQSTFRTSDVRYNVLVLAEVAHGAGPTRRRVQFCYMVA